MARLTALEKQQLLVGSANGLFTRSISGQSNNSDGTVTFTTSTDHNFVVGDYVILYDTMDDDNEITVFNTYSSVLQEFEVTAVTDDTFTITISYKASASLTDLKARSVLTFNNEQMKIGNKDYPVIMIEGRNTNRLLNNANQFIPSETEFVLTVMDKISHHTKGRNTQVEECRKFCEVKLNLILTEFKKKIISDKMRRGEFDWIDVPISFTDVRIEY